MQAWIHIYLPEMQVLTIGNQATHSDIIFKCHVLQQERIPISGYTNPENWYTHDDFMTYRAYIAGHSNEIDREIIPS